MPVYVNQYNIGEMQTLVDEGHANSVIRDDNVRVNLKYATNKKGTSITYGDKIIRNNKEIDPFSITYNTSGEASMVIDNFIYEENDKLKKKTGEVLDKIVQASKRRFKLEIGDIVERHLKNGDWTLFNRQPT